MDKRNIIIGDKEYTVEIADTSEEQKKGLQDREYLPQDSGMLFIYDKPQDKIEFWMKDTTIALDQIGINEDGEVVNKIVGAMDKENMKMMIED